MVLGQLLHAWSCRSRRPCVPAGAGPPNPLLSRSLVASCAVQALAHLLPPLRRLLGISPPGALDLALIGAGSLLPLLANELAKPPP
jgi:Ca2+-transporting ATPase